jgi:hypothetical protein
VLVDHVAELEPPAIGSGVELEVHGSHLVRVFGLVAAHRAVGWSGPLLLAGCGPLQTLLAPESVHPFVVHQPAFPSQQAVGHAPAPADVRRTVRCALQRGGDLEETMPQLSLLDRDDLGRMTLGAPVSEVSRRTARCALRRNKSHCFAEACG